VEPLKALMIAGLLAAAVVHALLAIKAPPNSPATPFVAMAAIMTGVGVFFLLI